MNQEESSWNGDEEMCHHNHVLSSQVLPSCPCLRVGTFESCSARTGNKAEDDAGSLGHLWRERGFQLWSQAVASQTGSRRLCVMTHIFSRLNGVCVLWGCSDKEKQELRVLRTGMSFVLFLHFFAQSCPMCRVTESWRRVSPSGQGVAMLLNWLAWTWGHCVKTCLFF